MSSLQGYISAREASCKWGVSERRVHWLSVCMVLTLLPVSAMAEDVGVSIGASGDIIAFAPLDETELSALPFDDRSIFSKLVLVF